MKCRGPMASGLLYISGISWTADTIHLLWPWFLVHLIALQEDPNMPLDGLRDCYLFTISTENSTVRTFPSILREKWASHIRLLPSLTRSHQPFACDKTYKQLYTPPYLGLGRTGSEVKGFVGPRKETPACWSLKLSELKYRQTTFRLNKRKRVMVLN